MSDRNLRHNLGHRLRSLWGCGAADLMQVVFMLHLHAAHLHVDSCSIHGLVRAVPSQRMLSQSNPAVQPHFVRCEHGIEQLPYHTKAMKRVEISYLCERREYDDAECALHALQPCARAGQPKCIRRCAWLQDRVLSTPQTSPPGRARGCSVTDGDCCCTA